MNINNIPITDIEKNSIISNTGLTWATICNENSEAISDLQSQGLTNAFIYLQRYKKNEKLNILEENSLYSILPKIQKQLGLSQLPKRIECYDISHLSGKFAYGSCVVFIDGAPNRSLYRLFKVEDKNDDFDNHAQLMRRRLSNIGQFGWEKPDLIIVDGGKGQLSTDLAVLSEFGLEGQIEMVSIAKKEEEIFTKYHLAAKLSNGYKLDNDCSFLLERIRDESHRFAITANRKARIRTITKTGFDKVVGIGPNTISTLIKTFGSEKLVYKAIENNPTLVIKLIGESKFNLLKGKK